MARAHFDGNQIVLDEELDMVAGARLWVTIF